MKEFFSDFLVHTQILTQWYRGLFTWGLKRSEHEVDHSPPSSVKVKKALS